MTGEISDEALRAIPYDTLVETVKTEAISGVAPEWRAALERNLPLWKNALSSIISSINTQTYEKRGTVVDWQTREQFEDWRRRSGFILRKVSERLAEVKSMELAAKGPPLPPGPITGVGKSTYVDAIHRHRDEVTSGGDRDAADVALWSLIPDGWNPG